MIASLPTGRFFRVIEPVPPVRVVEPRLAPLPKKMTVPVGVLPARPETTVAVRTTVWVGPGLGIDVVTATSGRARLTFATTAGEASP